MKKTNDFWQTMYGIYPKVPYNHSISKDLIVENTHVKGYVQWQPVEHTVVADLSTIEADLGIAIHPQIKEYFTSYSFLSIRGDVGVKCSNTKRLKRLRSHLVWVRGLKL